jgi:hypothetical protein
MDAERDIEHKECNYMKGPSGKVGRHHVPTRVGGTNRPAASPC